MRRHTLGLGLLLPLAAALSGCGVDSLAPLAGSATRPGAIRGKAHGGQLPVSGAQIALYTYGATGYGSAGTLLATATTDRNGQFSIDPASMNCPSPDSPLYILSVGGNPGNPPGQVNTAINLGAALGTCANAMQAYITINEISTAMLAYTFSQFFSASSYDGITYDHFGSPSDATQVVSNGNSGTVSTVLNTTQGLPNPNTPTMTFEGNKLITLGNILGACVNSLGPNSQACTSLFQNTRPANGAAPTNTLEAAVALAQLPTQNVAPLFALAPPGNAAAFPGGLTTAPADWTLSASFTSPSFGLAVNPRTVTTIDIDSNGRVWFPSNRGGAGGVGYFDPSSGTFSQLYTGRLAHPQQLAIDRNNYVWVADSGSPNIAGFPAANPSAPTLLSLPGSTSTTVTIGSDNNPRYGIIAPDGTLALAQVTGGSTYSEIPSTEFPFSIGFFASSLGGNANGTFAMTGQSLYAPLSYYLSYASLQGVATNTYQFAEDGGQVATNGTSFVAPGGGYAPGADGICVWSAQSCYLMANDTTVHHPSGLAVDGNGTLWLSDNATPTVEAVPLTGGSYLTAGGKANNTLLLHDTNNGGTLVNPAGIAVDRAGNVWVSNYGCNGIGCVPGSFTLSELIGAGAPTTTPVSKQLFRGAHAGIQPR